MTYRFQTHINITILNMCIHFGVNPTERIWFINKIMNLALTFDPVTLTFIEMLAIIDINPHTNFSFNLTNWSWVIFENVCWWMTNRPTDRPDYRDAFSFLLWTHLKNTFWPYPLIVPDCEDETVEKVTRLCRDGMADGVAEPGRREGVVSCVLSLVERDTSHSSLATATFRTLGALAWGEQRDRGNFVVCLFAFTLLQGQVTQR